MAEKPEYYTLPEVFEHLADRIPRERIEVDIAQGKLRLAASVPPEPGEDHHHRYLRANVEPWGDEWPDVMESTRPRLVWLETPTAVSLLRNRGNAVLTAADYPVFIDSNGATERYKVERVFFTEGAAVERGDIIVFAFELGPYLLKRDGQTLAPDPLPKLREGGKYIVGRHHDFATDNARQKRTARTSTDVALGLLRDVAARRLEGHPGALEAFEAAVQGRPKAAGKDELQPLVELYSTRHAGWLGTMISGDHRPSIEAAEHIVDEWAKRHVRAVAPLPAETLRERKAGVAQLQAQRDRGSALTYSQAVREWESTEAEAGDLQDKLPRLYLLRDFFERVADGKADAKAPHQIERAESIAADIRARLQRYRAGEDEARATTATKPAWRPKPSKHPQRYRKELDELIAAMHKRGEPVPTADRVLELWRENPPPGFEVHAKRFAYPSMGQNPREKVDSDALSKTIKRAIEVDN